MELITKYFPEIDSLQRSRFEALEPLYREWNAKINLVSRKDIDHLYERHILHSLAIARVIQFKSMTAIMDVGTGGGFPGIPLAIMFPKVEFHMVDSIGKKINAVQHIAEALQLDNVTTHHNRAEKVDVEVDFVVSRAVAPAKKIYNWTQSKILPNSFNKFKNGWFLLKGGDLSEELQELKRKRYKVFELSEFFEEEFFETKKILYFPKG